MKKSVIQQIHSRYLNKTQTPTDQVKLRLKKIKDSNLNAFITVLDPTTHARLEGSVKSRQMKSTKVKYKKVT